MKQLIVAFFALVLIGAIVDCLIGEDKTMNINNPLPPDRMYDDDGHLVRCKVLPIGAWDMNATPEVSVAHGMGANFINIIMFKKIVNK